MHRWEACNPRMYWMLSVNANYAVAPARHAGERICGPAEQLPRESMRESVLSFGVHMGKLRCLQWQLHVRLGCSFRLAPHRHHDGAAILSH